MNRKNKTKLAAIALCMASLATGAQERSNLRLRYDRPANYFEEALVLGNGTLGATVYGGILQDRISLNDITLWTGEPEKEPYNPEAYKALPEIRTLLDEGKYKEAGHANRKIQGHYCENYQPLGTLTIDYDISGTKEVKGYERWLNISNATAHSGYTAGGADFASDYFVSAPDSALVVRLKSTAPTGIHARVSFNSLLPHSVVPTADGLSAEGYVAYHSFPNYYHGSEKTHLYDPARGMRFRTLVKTVPTGGKVTTFPSGDIKIDGCSEVLILLVNATSFNGFDKDPVKEGKDYRNIAERRLTAVSAKNYDELRKAHTTDYKTYFDRVELNLGTTADSISSLTTDRQLLLYTDRQQANPELEALYFQYGRYLLISCSRTPGVPANLQGLWNEKILPPWSCNYTSNINLEENYWAAETTNLSEMHLPMLDFVKNLSQSGTQTAKAYYGVEQGWCLGHNTDIWAMTNPVGLNSGDPSWACWNMGGAWVSTHIWEHYMFTQDKSFLRAYYPILKSAAEFCINWLVEKDGHLITSPGTSPENVFMTPDGYAASTSFGNTSDLAMTRECLTDALKAAAVLGEDKAFRKKTAQILARLLPYHIGKKGNLQEWYYDWEDQDPRHRHQSHLFGLYPGHHLSISSTPDLARACTRTLEIKGDETTGWSSGWRVNLFARLADAEGAYHIYRKLLQYVSPDDYRGNDARRGGGTYPNLLDAHSPFQIDGNFGGCAGVAEMLLQSSETDIRLLPALPVQWKDGKVSGLCARGGFVIDMEWKDGKVTSLSLTARTGGKTILRYNGKTKAVSMKQGETKSIML
ncbi:MAG: glycoside hydrolase N-terminal domain-containing protein [Bacteroides sp.]|nr:glycoside hydrolase N-terminal domain-containing protein [Roseburia sp.]MCM1346259.1 glycoside hydrolase N-terminal domain-containing protein [Bacteroides sp.]MCM1420832.1 glycoside hydrolase N-terminal domain-containing protein [Bacteroides sp.]